ncbi:MAG: hypothetical protein IKQ54_08765 [Oscillospiraceae bacterium]|nr:hypothetical protein [Oscillospiraceae bacterium]MBR7010206.1 hypothetical protein [Oscillospiraceae bacterium]
MQYAFIGLGVILLVIAALVIRNKKINGEISQNGIEANAVVTRVKENVSTDSDGMVSISHSYYVTYRARNGQDVEALLGSGKSFEFNIGKKAWDYDLHEGSQLRIKYLPEKPSYAIRIES